MKFTEWELNYLRMLLADDIVNISSKNEHDMLLPTLHALYIKIAQRNLDLGAE